MDIGPLLVNLLVGFRVARFDQRRARGGNQKLEKCNEHDHIISRGKLSSCVEYYGTTYHGILRARPYNIPHFRENL